MDPRRTERVAETLRGELEELINYELSDPRVGQVTVTEVLVAPDMRLAHVRLALEGDEHQQTATIEALDHAKGFLRKQIAERLELYRTPDLRFFCDVSPALRQKAPSVLRRIRRGRPRE
jgi:ribosome-binding factor A